MTRRLLGLIVALSLTSACKDAPVGQMEPIPRPPGTPAAPPPETAAPKPAPEPAPDPSKVVLRWKLAAPAAFRLTTTSTGAPSAPADEDSKGKKGKSASAPAASGPSEHSALFVLHKTDSGDYAFRIVPQGEGAPADEGSMSERGFVLDGLPPPLRNTAVLVLELPRDPVGPSSTWALGTNLVDVNSMTTFTEKKAERRNQVKLASLTPGDGGEQVAALEYDLSENISGEVRVPKAAPAPKAKPDPKKKAGGKKGEEAEDGDVHGETLAEDPGDEFVLTPASAVVRVKGKGEFLVKAGRWRTWEATLTTTTEGAAMPGVTPGERTLRLTPVEPVPPEHLPSAQKK